jgi:hypothetical protein
VLLGIASLFFVSGFGVSIWAIGLPPSWTVDYDRASYRRITRAIAADPQYLCGRPLYDVIRELGLEDVPWDDGNAQSLAGSCRIYHFRGFSLCVTLEYMRQGVTENVLLERGSPEEKLQNRALLWTNLNQSPFVMLDGIKRREERMRQYRAWNEESIKQLNKKMESKLRRLEPPVPAGPHALESSTPPVQPAFSGRRTTRESFQFNTS